ncbi:hypothetical protein [Mariniblastus fucicola]|uniref:Uncharacterized protein n=1 Tax=Mariniblastus fucicola TaxID=980251 RepID=A0A5B9P7D6_9BACT|nr:hypothetical protein [Mariniblastus fucicola]QEG22228.1 hypothetical protein MFFC18_21040 [Mariniblastus fucicola]
MKTDTQNQFYAFALEAMRLYWGDTETRLPKLIVTAGLALLASPLWELIVYIAAGEKYSAIIDKYQDGSQTVGFILLAFGTMLFVWLKSRNPVQRGPKPRDLKLSVTCSHMMVSTGETLRCIVLEMANHGTLPVTIKAAELKLDTGARLFIGTNCLTNEIFGNVSIQPGDTYSLPISVDIFADNDIDPDRVASATVRDGLGETHENTEDIRDVIETIKGWI